MIRKEYHRAKNYGRYAILIGFSIITSILITSIIKNNSDILYKFIENIGFIKAWFITGGVALIIEGVIILNKPEIIQNVWILLGRILPLLIAISIPGGFFFNEQQIKLDYYILFIINGISIYIFLLEFTTALKSLYEIFEKNIKESKDRLSIIVAIIGTLISLIALFK